MTGRRWTIGGGIAAGLLLVLAVLVRRLIPEVQPSPGAAAATLAGLAALAAAAAALLGRGTPRLRTFWGSLLLGAGAAAPLLLSGLPAHLPLLGPLWARDDVARPMVTLVAVVAAWCFAVLYGRVLAARAEALAVRTVEGTLPDRFEADPRRQVDALRASPGVAPGTFTARRIVLLMDCCTAQQRMEPLLAERAALDEAELQAAYGPLRALVWALPALGFIGTAAAMSASIAGIGTALRGSAAATAQEHLLGRVMPQLADAFGITLVALGASVICFFALSLVFEREERELNRLDALMLRLLTRVHDARPGAGGDPSDRLFAELWSVERELARLNGVLEALNNGQGFSDTLSAYLTAVYQQVALVGLAIRGVPGEEDAEGLAPLLRTLRDELRRLNDREAAGGPGPARVPVPGVVHAGPAAGAPPGTEAEDGGEDGLASAAPAGRPGAVP
jgi:MotA/TolQ/ExbB proton channel family